MSTGLTTHTAGERPPVSLWPLKALLAVSVTGALVIACVAFYGSFQHLAEFSHRVGAVTAADAWVIPVIIDATIIVAVLIATIRRLLGKPARYAVAVAAVYVGLSVAVNALYAWPRRNPGTWEGPVIAALLPIALAVTSHMVVTEIHDLIHRHTLTPTGHPAGLVSRLGSALIARLEPRPVADHPTGHTDQPDHAGGPHDDRPAGHADRSPLGGLTITSSNRRQIAAHVYQRAEGNLTRTAELLGVGSRNTLKKWGREDGWLPTSNSNDGDSPASANGRRRRPHEDPKTANGGDG